MFESLIDLVRDWYIHTEHDIDFDIIPSDVNNSDAVKITVNNYSIVLGENFDETGKSVGSFTYAIYLSDKLVSEKTLSINAKNVDKAIENDFFVLASFNK